jgi:hypothetical protein
MHQNPRNRTAVKGTLSEAVGQQRTFILIIIPAFNRHVTILCNSPLLKKFEHHNLRRLGFKPGSNYMGFVVDNVALGHHISSGAGTIGQ